MKAVRPLYCLGGTRSISSSWRSMPSRSFVWLSNGSGFTSSKPNTTTCELSSGGRSMRGTDVLGVRLAGALGLFWYACGYHAEGRQWSDRLLERLDSVPTIYHTKLLTAAGHMALLCDPDVAKDYFDRALQISREVGDPVNTAWALTFKGFAILGTRSPLSLSPEQGCPHFRSCTISQVLRRR